MKSDVAREIIEKSIAKIIKSFEIIKQKIEIQ